MMLCVCTCVQAFPADTVYVFWSIDCPVCKSMVQELHGIMDSVSTPVVCVVPDGYASTDEVVEFQQTYRTRFTIVMDSGEVLQQRFTPGITPEAFVVHDGRVVYQGRINNRYVAIGRRRQVVTEHDVRDVLHQLQRGIVPAFRKTQAVGCVM